MANVAQLFDNCQNIGETNFLQRLSCFLAEVKLADTGVHRVRRTSYFHLHFLIITYANNAFFAIRLARTIKKS